MPVVAFPTQARVLVFQAEDFFPRRSEISLGFVELGFNTEDVFGVEFFDFVLPVSHDSYGFLRCQFSFEEFTTPSFPFSPLMF